VSGSGALGIAIAAGTASDAVGNLAAAAGPSATFTVNTPPVVSGAVTVTANAKNSVSPFVRLGITDVDTPAQILAVTITLDATNKGAFTAATLASTGFGNPAPGVYQFSGTAAACVAAIRGLSYAPSIDPSLLIFTPPNTYTATNTTIFTVAVSDGVAPTVSNSSSKVTARLLNHSPTAGPALAVQRPPTQGTKIAFADLVAGASDPDNDSLTVSAVVSPTPDGATVTLDQGWLFYTPAPGSTNADTVTYTISDGYGGTTTGTANITIIPDNAPSQNVSSIQNLGGGSYQVTFTGIPFRTYTVQFTTDLVNPTWTTLGQATADATGTVTYVDTSAAGTRFYRTVYP